MKSEIEFKNTSFLILVKDEEFFSKKLIEHINNQNINAELIIADGSKKSQKKFPICEHQDNESVCPEWQQKVSDYHNDKMTSYQRDFELLLIV